MKQITLTYAQADSCFYEAMRINKTNSTEWSTAKEGNALIDTNRTKLNYELIPHHDALNPDDYYKRNRGHGIAMYHKSVTGRSARMGGEDKQKSKAIGCIITLPKDYLDIDYGLTNGEYMAIEKYIEADDHKSKVSESEAYKSALSKVKNHMWTDKEQEQIREFFSAALKAWQQVATIRDEEMLYAIVHLDESFPHLHIMALPTVEKEDGKITFSTGKYSNKITHYFDRLHENVINEMAKYGVDGSGLLNGSTSGKGFVPADMSKADRDKAEELKARNILIDQNLQMKEMALNSLEQKIDKLQGTLLEEEQAKKLVQNKSLKSLVKGGAVNVELSYEDAQALKKSILTKKALDAKSESLSLQEMAIKERQEAIEKEVAEKVEERLPEKIREWEQVIPKLEKLRDKQKKKEEELKNREDAVKRKETDLKGLEHKLDLLEHDLDNEAEKRAKSSSNKNTKPFSMNLSRN